MPVARNGEVELSYRELGPNAGPTDRTLLLIMGIDLTSAHWGDAFLDGLARDRRVIVFDNRGTGASTRRVEAITAELWAQDACAVLDAAGASRVDVLGYSMGGRIAQELAVRHRDRVERLVLLSSTVGSRRSVMPEPAGMAALMPRPGVEAETLVRDKLLAIAGPGFETAHPEHLASLIEASLRKPTHGSIVEKQLGVLATNVTRELEQLDAPTLIIHGDADPLVPIGNGELLHELIPGSHMERLERIGHLPTWECTQRVVGLVNEFLAASD